MGFPDSSVGKESTCNAGDPGSIPGSERSAGEWIGVPSGSAGKESACNAGDLGSIPGLGRSPGEGKGYPLQCSGLENSMDSIVHGVAKSRTQLSHFHLSCSNIPVGIIKWPLRTINQLLMERAGCRHLLTGRQKKGDLPPAVFTHLSFTAQSVLQCRSHPGPLPLLPQSGDLCRRKINQASECCSWKNGLAQGE